MMREHRYFQGILTAHKSATTSDGESVQKNFTIRHVMEGEIQNFLHSYADACNYDNVKSLFQTPVMWKNIAIESKYKMKVTFDALEFEAVLVGIKVSKKYVKNVDTYTYDLLFTMEPDKDIDPVLEMFLKQKETDENGRKKLVLFDVLLEPIEKLMLD